MFLLRYTISQFLFFVCVCVLFSATEVLAITPENLKSLLSKPPSTGKISVEFFGASQLANTNKDSLIGTEFDFEWMGENVKLGQFRFPQTKAITTNTLVFATGDYQGQRWEYSNNRVTSFDNGASHADDSIGSRFIFKSLLHFGIQQLVPESLIWNGNEFTGTVLLDNSKIPISGMLTVDSNLNRVVGLNYKLEGSDISYKITYAYAELPDKNNEAQLPIKIVIYGFGAIGNNPLMVFKINEYNDNASINATDLDPNVIFRSAQKVQLTQNGLKASFITPQVRHDNADSNSKARYVIVFLFVLTSCVLIWLIKRSGLVKTNNKTKNEKEK